MMSDMMADLQKQGNGELSHSRGPVGGDVGDSDPLLLCRLRIDHIIACGQNADITDTGAGLHGFSGHRGLVGDYDLGGADPVYDLLRGGPVIDLELTQSLKALPA